jgi:hypothetical protein
MVDLNPIKFGKQRPETHGTLVYCMMLHVIWEIFNTTHST